jgi:uncharacterized protein with HEPN domain
MQPKSPKLLRDMQDAAGAIAGFVAGKTEDEYMRDTQLRMAVERGFEIIGEALSQLRKIDPETAESITDWQAIIGFRNVLIHGYSLVDHAKTWDILQTELPVLRRELDELLAHE